MDRIFGRGVLWGIILSLLTPMIAFGNAVCTDGVRTSGPFFAAVGNLYAAVGWLQADRGPMAAQSIKVAKEQLAEYSGNLEELVSRRKADENFGTSLSKSIANLDRKRASYETSGFVLAGSDKLGVWSEIGQMGARGVGEFLELCRKAVVTLEKEMVNVESRIAAGKKLDGTEILMFTTNVESAILRSTYTSVVFIPIR